ncbi:MAG: NAD(P)H-dependent oxidoreductase [Erysipelotrichales bacterium]|nr:NAD(P)H-dependent oxidoreductase [Erysipelotrichales bacterium]
MKNLVIYYSRSGENYVNGKVTNLAKGNTEYIAEFIRDAANADVFKIETVKEYAANYMDCIREAQKELDSAARPELRKYLDDISEYDNIFIAGPCWWGTYPMAVFSAIEGLDFTGKTVLPLMTHEGSGLGHCERDLKNILKGAKFAPGLAVHGADVKKSESVIVNWVRKNI